MRHATVAAIGLAWLTGMPVAADALCRATALGSVACPVARPEPRPYPGPDTQALDRVRRAAPPADVAPVFVPARQTSTLGRTRLPDDARPVSRCRPDRLGNLRCQ